MILCICSAMWFALHQRRPNNWKLYWPVYCIRLGKFQQILKDSSCYSQLFILQISSVWLRSELMIIYHKYIYFVNYLFGLEHKMVYTDLYFDWVIECLFFLSVDVMCTFCAWFWNMIEKNYTLRICFI